MSSHHFVKEGQEPALVILEAYSLEVVEPLLEWAPLVIVTETALNDVLRWGIKIDVVVTSGSATALDAQLSDHGPVKFIATSSSDQPLTAILQFLVREKQTAVTIVTNAHATAISAAEDYGKSLNISLLTHRVRWSFIGAGHFKKWMPAGTQLIVQSALPVMVDDGSGSRQLYSDIIPVGSDGMITLKAEAGFWIGESV